MIGNSAVEFKPHPASTGRSAEKLPWAFLALLALTGMTATLDHVTAVAEEMSSAAPITVPSIHLQPIRPSIYAELSRVAFCGCCSADGNAPGLLDILAELPRAERIFTVLRQSHL
jgi:hypothetical protein